MQALTAQRSFRLIFDESFLKTLGHDSWASLLISSPRVPFTYPYGRKHDWDVQRYLRQKADLKGEQYSAALTFEGDNVHLAVLTQSVAQDSLWAAFVAARMATNMLYAYFVPLNPDNPECVDDEYYHFYAIVNMPSNKSYKPAMTRLTNKSPDIKLSLHVKEKNLAMPRIDRFEQWPNLADATWDARIMHGHKTFDELNGHRIGEHDLVLRVRQPKIINGEKPCKILVKTFSDRSTANTARCNDENNWNIVTLLMDPHLEEAVRKVEAVCQFKPDAEPTGVKGSKGAFNSVEGAMQLHRDLVLGNGFSNSFWRPESQADSRDSESSDDDLCDNMEEMRLHSIGDLPSQGNAYPPANGHATAPSLPVLNLLNVSDEYHEALMHEILLDDRERFTKYMRNRPLGLAVIAAGPGFGKTTAMAVATLGMAESFQKVYASAPTHVAVDNFASRLDLVDRLAVARFNEGKPEEMRRRHRLIVRGFKLEDEIIAFRALLKNPDLGKDAHALRSEKGDMDSRWRLDLSLTYWLLMILGSRAVRDMNDVDDSQFLLHYRAGLHKDQDLTRLQQLVNCDIPWDKEDEISPSDKTRCEQSLSETVLKECFTCLLEGADIVCTTPSLSTKQPYRDWRCSRAKGIAVDEAATTSRPDLYSVWGNCLAPCILGGDEKQLQPAVMTEDERDKSRDYLNRHVEDGRISALAFFKMSGWPVFRLHTQFRMVEGLFDLCHEAIYKDLTLQYGPGSELGLHPEGHNLEMYLQRKYKDLRPPPTNKLLPVFIDCVGSKTVKDKVTKSKRNWIQVELALEFIYDLVTETEMDPAIITVIAPYKANARLFEHLRVKTPKYSKTLASMGDAVTVDSCQGRENEIIVVIMGTTSDSGAGFTLDKHRLNVMFTRQKSGLVVFGDIYVAKDPDKHAHEARGRRRNDTTVLCQMYKYFKDHGRVARSKWN